VTIPHLIELRDRYIEERKHFEKQLAKEKVKRAAASLDELIANAQVFNGLKLVWGGFDVESMDDLKAVGDSLRVKMNTGVGLIYAVIGEKVNLCAVVTDDLIREKKLNAGKIVAELGKLLGGGGGGRPHLATAGGKEISKLNQLLVKFPEIVKKYISAFPEDREGERAK